MPLLISVTADRVPAANAPLSIERVTVTALPVAGACVIESVIRNSKLLSAWFFLQFEVIATAATTDPTEPPTLPPTLPVTLPTAPVTEATTVDDGTTACTCCELSASGAVPSHVDSSTFGTPAVVGVAAAVLIQSITSVLTSALPAVPVKLIGCVVPWLALIVVTLDVETLLMFLALVSGMPAVAAVTAVLSQRTTFASIMPFAGWLIWPAPLPRVYRPPAASAAALGSAVSPSRTPSNGL